MGSLQLWVSVGSDLVKQKIIMNKFLAVLCLAAGVIADADPYYAAYGYSGLGAYAGYPYAAAYGGFPYGLGYAAGYASVSNSAAVNINGLAPAALPAVAGGYAGAGRYTANSGGVVHVAEREAEAEADPYYAAYGYAGYPYAGAYGAYPYGLGYAAGYASVSPSAAVSINGLAPAALPALAGGYAGAGGYVANSAGVVHVAKREAEAEADPYYAAYGYAGLGYVGAYGLGYAGAYGAYPYGLGYGYGGYANLGASGAVNIAGLAPAAAPAVAGGYAAAGRYCANSAGVVHCA